MTEYKILSIGGILDHGTDRKVLEQHLKGFCCSRDKQLEDFIRAIGSR